MREMSAPPQWTDALRRTPQTTVPLVDSTRRRLPLPRATGGTSPQPNQTEIAAAVAHAVETAMARIPPPTPGKDGKSADMDAILNYARQVAEFEVADLPKPKDGKPGQRGRPGAKGDDGVTTTEIREIVTTKADTAPMATPMLEQQWNGTRLRLRFAGGPWGRWVDLRGPRGRSGGIGVATAAGAGGDAGAVAAAVASIAALATNTKLASVSPTDAPTVAVLNTIATRYNELLAALKAL